MQIGPAIQTLATQSLDTFFFWVVVWYLGLPRNNPLSALACNLEFHVHTQDIDIHHHYICKKLKDEVIDHQYISLLMIKLQTFSLNLSKQLNILNLLEVSLILSQSSAWRVCWSIQACAFLIQIMCIMSHFHKCQDMLLFSNHAIQYSDHLYPPFLHWQPQFSSHLC